MQADALAQYEGPFTIGGIVYVVCNAHAPRRFPQAQTSSPDEGEEEMKYIRMLYKVERELGEQFAGDEDAGRQQCRSAQTAAVRDELHSWLARHQAQALPKSPLGEAVGYAQSNWQALVRYTEQAYLAIDNDRSERALRHVVVGRANLTFCSSAAGGRTAALYSMVGTCKHLGIDPFAYLREALPRLFALGKSQGRSSCWSGFQTGGYCVALVKRLRLLPRRGERPPNDGRRRWPSVNVRMDAPGRDEHAAVSS